VGGGGAERGIKNCRRSYVKRGGNISQIRESSQRNCLCTSAIFECESEGERGQEWDKEGIGGQGGNGRDWGTREKKKKKSGGRRERI